MGSAKSTKKTPNLQLVMIYLWLPIIKCMGMYHFSAALKLQEAELFLNLDPFIGFLEKPEVLPRLSLS